MILSLYCPTNFVNCQFFCRTERKPLYLVLPCALLKCNGTTSSSTRMLLFWQRHRDNAQRAFRQEWSWVRNLSVRYIFSCCFIDNNTCSLVASLIITFAFHCKLYLIHNEWSRRLEKIRCNINCFPTLSWPWRNL